MIVITRFNMFFSFSFWKNQNFPGANKLSKHMIFSQKSLDETKNLLTTSLWILKLTQYSMTAYWVARQGRVCSWMWNKIPSERLLSYIKGIEQLLDIQNSCECSGWMLYSDMFQSIFKLIRSQIYYLKYFLLIISPPRSYRLFQVPNKNKNNSLSSNNWFYFLISVQSDD